MPLDGSLRSTAASDLVELYRSESACRLYDESVTQLEHALQCAALAVATDAPDHMIIAALVHDVGHLVDDERVGDERVGRRIVDGRHERVGARYLAQWFGPEITEPVALHVAAKRYLCATDAAYSDALSPASMRSLGFQGGAMTADEQRSFAQDRRARDAVQLRRWDDEAKVVGLTVPDFASFVGLIEGHSRPFESSTRG
jgi:phosphonate degradation associated HDIG domain protein